jgi:hypothetical protein
MYRIARPSDPLVLIGAKAAGGPMFLKAAAGWSRPLSQAQADNGPSAISRRSNADSVLAGRLGLVQLFSFRRMR